MDGVRAVARDTGQEAEAGTGSEISGTAVAMGLLDSFTSSGERNYYKRFIDIYP